MRSLWNRVASLFKQSPLHPWRWLVRAIEKTENATLAYTRPTSNIAFKGFEPVFYPKNKNKKISQADKTIMPIIALACIVTLLDFLIDGYDDKFTFFNHLFLAIFSIEYIFRANYKGVAYTKSWIGVIDALVILADLTQIAVIVLSSVIDIPLSDEIVLFRLLRFFRFIRLVKLAYQIARSPEYWLPIFAHSFAVLKALFIALLWVAGFLLILMVVSHIFLDANSNAVPNLISQFVADKLVYENDANSDDIGKVLSAVTHGTALIITLVISLFIGQTLFPIIDRIQRERKVLLSNERLVGHIVVVVFNSKSISILEEIVHVGLKYREKELVVVFSTDIDESEIPHFKGVKNVVDDVYNPYVWDAAYASTADMILILGSEQAFSTHLPILVANTTDVYRKSPKYVFIGDFDSYQRYPSGELVDGELIFIPLDKLIASIATSVWLPSSLQFNFLKLLIDHFDEKIQFPILSPSSLAVPAESDLIKFTEQFKRIGAIKEQVDRNILLYFEHESTPKEEISLLALINDIEAELGDNFKKYNFFLYVRTLGLMDLNLVFQQRNIHNIIVFPVELAAVMAIFHEVYAPRIMPAWLLPVSKQELGDLLITTPSPFPSASYYTREEIADSLIEQGIDGSVVGIKSNDLRYSSISDWRLFPDHEDRDREVLPMDEIVLIDNTNYEFKS